LASFARTNTFFPMPLVKTVGSMAAVVEDRHVPSMSK
jgi:hypothetical protein